jgi:hypothetical protein
MNAALLRGGVKTDPSRLVGRSIYWTVVVLASITALGALNLTPIVVGFGITWGGIVLAGAIAFGLGAADLAKEFLERRLGGSIQIQRGR